MPDGAGDGGAGEDGVSLVYMADVDGPLRRHLSDLAEVAGGGLDRAFGHCAGYPAAGPGSASRQWLRRHLGAARGEALGEARGEAHAVLTVFDARGVPVPDAVREQILACTDLTQLDTWLRRAVTAASAEDVIGP
jgi:hypothetical protein